MALSQNGTRQPHDWSCSSGSTAASGRNTAGASTWPPWVPLRVKLVKKPRRSSGACSNDIELAPACSPAAERPWSRRRITSRTGASSPTWSYVGRQPTRKVETPISRRVPISTFFRPSLSPMWPIRNEPIGRATYATPKVAKAATVAAESLPSGKKMSGKTSAAAVP